MLNTIGKVRLGRHALYTLEARDDFQRYLDDITRGPVEQARAKYLRRLPEAVDAYWESLDQARAKKDYTAVAQIVAPAIDRVVPRKQEAVAATQVNIVLSPSQLAGIQHYDAPTIETEIVEAEPEQDASA